MPISNPLEILLLHDKWATDQILAGCDKLSPEKLDKPFAIGPGSVRKTLVHMNSAVNAWTDTLLRQSMRPRPDQSGISYSIADLKSMHEASARQFMEVSKAHPLEEIVTRIREGKEFSFTRGAVITHVATHGMHHRAQLLNMLKQIGVQPLPPSSVTEWTLYAS